VVGVVVQGLEDGGGNLRRRHVDESHRAFKYAVISNFESQISKSCSGKIREDFAAGKDITLRGYFDRPTVVFDIAFLETPDMPSRTGQKSLELRR